MASKKPSLCGNSVSGGVLTGAGDDDGDDKTVDTKDTSHDDGDDGLDNELGLEDSDGADADAGLGSAVGGTHVAENEGTDDSHAAEEKSLVGVTVHYIHIECKVRLLFNLFHLIFLSSCSLCLCESTAVIAYALLFFPISTICLTYKEWGW